ncbi:MAG TPA: hypothetical protein VHY32_05965 [Caulobacteraceae bacterium]|jgi:hypothetical protein|nr:hypothetical protein [Caulobacteraceae bacterium]
MLAERLSKQWRARQALVPVQTAMSFGPEGLVLGARTVLAPAEADGPRRSIRLEGREARIGALLSAAHLKPIPPAALTHIRKAAEHWGEGRAALAEVHLALSGVSTLADPGPGAQRLFLADGLLQAGVEPDAILKALINPGNPTPDGFGIGMPSPVKAGNVMFDDCQRRSGILFEYKGPTYAELLQSSIQGFVLKKLISQAERQVSSSDGRHIIWIFEEEDAKDYVRNAFSEIPSLKDKIQFDYEPMPGFSI